ncbi:MAG TPA: hypothetical protein VK206_19790 [Anaerolineales bacterium]|nr:hypothetical protein [Anaerolineales bacterium]
MDGTTITGSHPVGRGPKYLIRDRDKKYATRFSGVALGSGIKEVKTSIEHPKRMGFAKGSWAVFEGNAWIISSFIETDTWNGWSRNTQHTLIRTDPIKALIDQRIPDRYDLTRSKPTRGQIISKAIPEGLHHSYSRRMYLN